MVTHIDEDGYVSFDTIGGWDHQVFVGQRVQSLGRGGPVVGVVGKKAIHLMEKDDRDKVSKVEDLWIDIGAASRAEARAAASDRRSRCARRRRARVSQWPHGEPLDRQPDRRLRSLGSAAAALGEPSRHADAGGDRRGHDAGGDRSDRRRRPLVGRDARARRRHRRRRDPRDRLPRHRQAEARRLPAGRRARSSRGARR